MTAASKSHFPFFLGMDYYPEQCDRSLWESDADRMADLGVKAIRIMEFAWILIEPEEGKYDFSLFDEVITLFASRGIKTVIGTPTATPPIWLYEKYPDIMQVYPDGTYRDFGGRRQPCFNADPWLDATGKIVEALALHYGNNPHIVGWQVDNELGHEGSDKCVCGHCKVKWSTWLEKKYGTVQALNEAWGTVFWGTIYNRFNQVPLPKKGTGLNHNPSLLIDYARFISDAAVAYVGMQADIIRSHAKNGAWVSTDIFMPSLSSAIDMEKLAAKLDLTGINNYPVWGDFDEPLPHFFISYNTSYCRGLKKSGHFTVFEQMSGIQGHTCLGYLPPPRQISLWTNKAIAGGADKLFYFRWRTAPYGQEQLCYGVIDHDNNDSPLLDEIRRNFTECAELHRMCAESTLEAECCLVYDKDNARLLRDQYLSKGLYLEGGFIQPGYEAEMARWYAPYNVFNVNVDIMSAVGIDPDKYRVISLPMYVMADSALVDKLVPWVENGGTLILGWRAGARDTDNHATTEILPGPFSKLAGIFIRRFESLNRTKVPLTFGLLSGKGEVWADIIELGTAKAVAWYGGKKHYRGKPAITVNNFGKGTVWYVGTSPDPLATFLLYRSVFKKAGIKTRFAGTGTEIITRTLPDGKKLEIILNHDAKSKLISGRKVSGYGTAWRVR